MPTIAVSQSLAAKATTAVTVVTYKCLGGGLSVAYARKRSGEESVIVELADKTVRMWRLKDRSEPVFVSLHDDTGSYRWRPKGESGVLSRLGPEATATEKILFDDCHATSAK